MESTISLFDTNNVNSEESSACTAPTLSASLTLQGKKTQPSGFSFHSLVKPTPRGFKLFTGCSLPNNWVLLLPAPLPALDFIAHQQNV